MVSFSNPSVPQLFLMILHSAKSPRSQELSEDRLAVSADMVFKMPATLLSVGRLGLIRIFVFEQPVCAVKAIRTAMALASTAALIIVFAVPTLLKLRCFRSDFVDQYFLISFDMSAIVSLSLQLSDYTSTLLTVAKSISVSSATQPWAAGTPPALSLSTTLMPLMQTFHVVASIVLFICGLVLLVATPLRQDLTKRLQELAADAILHYLAA